MKYSVGDRVVVTHTTIADESQDIKVGDVAKVVWVDDYGDPYCHNPEWKQDLYVDGGREMLKSQLDWIME